MTSPLPYTPPPGALLVEAGSITQEHIDAGGRWAYAVEPRQLNDWAPTELLTACLILFWPPPPKPERVQWWEAVRDRLTVPAYGVVLGSGWSPDGATAYLHTATGKVFPASDGTVEVLAQEPEEAFSVGDEVEWVSHSIPRFIRALLPEYDAAVISEGDCTDLRNINVVPLDRLRLAAAGSGE